jgi:hypothetical protein
VANKVTNPSQKSSEPKAPSAPRGSLGPTFYPTDKARTIWYCLEHDLCDCVRGPTRRPAGHEMQSFKLWKASAFDGSQMNLSVIFREDLLWKQHIYSIIAFGLTSSQHVGRWQKSWLPNPVKDPKFSPQNYYQSTINLLLTTGKLFEKLILRTIQEHTEERN